MLCVIAKIDKSARARLSWIQSFAASFGIVPRPIYGHITLAAFESGDEAALIAGCKEALTGQMAFSVDFETVEVLGDTSIIAALAAREGALDAVQERIAAVAPQHLDSWTRRENWVPHTTLLHDHRMDLKWIRSAMQPMFQPFTARVEQIEFSRVLDHGYETVDTVELKGESV